MTAELLISPHGSPELLFSLGEVVVDGTAARGSMTTAAWMRHDDGRPAAGLLGVLLDVIVGQPTLVTRPEAMWPVTTELAIDMVRAPESDGRTVLAHGDLVAADDAVALSRGTARDRDGTVLAAATARTRYTAGVPDLAAAEAAAVPGPAGAGTIRSVYDAELDGPHLRVPPGPAMLNAAGNVHGGVLLCLADLLASSVVAPALVTGSLRFAYLRPGSAAGALELTAHVRHHGRTTALVDVEAVGGDGRLCALGRVSFLAAGQMLAS